MTRRKLNSDKQSWGLSCGLLAGCGITLTGVVLNLQPETILLRTVVGSCLVAILATAITAGWRLLAPTAEED